MQMFEGLQQSGREPGSMSRLLKERGNELLRIPIEVGQAFRLKSAGVAGRPLVMRSVPQLIVAGQAVASFGALCLRKLSPLS
jgi:hypothetical protein